MHRSLIRLAALTASIVLAACSADLTGGSAELQTAQGTTGGLNGRWMLAAPKAPPCGLMLGGRPGAREGSVAPEGGCPLDFYRSRRWALEGGSLLIRAEDGDTLGTLASAGDHFAGKSANGTPLTLTRDAVLNSQDQ